MKEHSLTTEQLARVFGERIGQKFITPVDSIQALYEISVKIADTWLNEIYNIKGCTLLLTPLEKISDEDAKALGTILIGNSNECELIEIDNTTLPGYADILYKEFESGVVKISIYRGGDLTLSRKTGPDSFTELDSAFLLVKNAYDFLAQQGYDVPMFFGIDHPDNGKTLTELGIAIDKTTI